MANGTWRVDFSYMSIFYGKRKHSCKRGFTRNRDAVIWATHELYHHIANKECALFKEETKELKKQSEKLRKMHEEYKMNRKDSYCYE